MVAMLPSGLRSDELEGRDDEPEEEELTVKEV